MLRTLRKFGGGGRSVTNVPVRVSGTASGARAPDATISLGLGLTNECNLSCAFCYRDPTRTDRLSLDQVKSVMERLPIRSVNLGTGENGMHPEFRAILAYLRTQSIKLTITSNGHSVAVLEDNELRAFHDFAETDVIAIGEPLVRAMAGLPPLRGGCGVSTVRVTPRATTQPCVYWPGSGEPLSDLISMGLNILDSAPFDQARTLPDTCQPCEFRESCHGGCAGRRRLQGALLQPDYYCPIIRGERPSLQIRMAATRDLPKLSSSCTTVVIAR